MKPELSVLMVSYNTREMTLACLRSVYAETKETDFEIILVDNASKDGSVDAIGAAFPQVRVIAMDDNLGFARGSNLAAEHASGEFLLLLNTDTVILDGAIDRVVSFARERPDAGIWGGRTLYGDGRLNPTSCWRHMTPWSLFSQVVGLRALFESSPVFNAEGYGNWQRDCVRQVDIVTGCFFLITRNLWHELGGFADEFFMYGEEADLCLRARAKGAAPLISPAATIIHHGGASTLLQGEKTVRQMQAKIELMKRHWPNGYRRLGRALLVALAGTRLLAARLAESAGHTSQRERALSAWRQVWRERRVWLQGYPLGLDGARD